MKKPFYIIAAALSLAVFFVSCRKDSEKGAGDRPMYTPINGNVDVSTGPDIEYKLYESFSSNATDQQIVYVMLMNQLQYSLQTIQHYANKVVLEKEFNNIIHKIDKSKLNDKNGDAVAAFEDMLGVIGDLKLTENQKIFIKQQVEKEKSEAINKSLRGTALPAIASIVEIGEGISKKDIGSIISGLASAVYTGVSAVFNYNDTLNTLDNRLRTQLFEINQNNLRMIDGYRKSLFKTYTHFIINFNIPKRYEIKEDQMKWLVETLDAADDYAKIRLLKTKVDIFQAFTPFWYELGSSYQRIGDTENAKKCYAVFEKQKARYSIIDNDTYYTELAKNMIQIAKEENNISSIKKYLKIIESDETVENESENRLYAANIHFYLGEYDEAFHLLKLVIDDNKEFVVQARELYEYMDTIKSSYDTSILTLLLSQLKIASQEETKNLVSEIKRRSSKEELKTIGKLDKNNLTFVLPEEYGKKYSLNVLVDGKLYDATLLTLDSKYYYAIKYSANKFFKNKKELKVILTGKDNEQITLEYDCNYYNSGDVKLLKNAFALLSTQKDLELDISNISQINLGEFLTNLKILSKDKLYKKSTDDDKIKYLTEKYERASKSFVAQPYKYKNNILFPSNSYIFEYGLEYILDNAKRYGISKYGDLEPVQSIVPTGMESSLEETYKNALLGDSDAEYNLGMIYLNGEGVAIDSTEAIKWFKLSSAQNNMKADYQLALCLEKGIGIAKDKELAMHYYQKAANEGHAKAKERVSK